MICQLLLSCTGTLCLNDFGSVSVLREDQTIQTQLSYRESHYQSMGPYSVTAMPLMIGFWPLGLLFWWSRLSITCTDFDIMLLFFQIIRELGKFWGQAIFEGFHRITSLGFLEDRFILWQGNWYKSFFLLSLIFC